MDTKTIVILVIVVAVIVVALVMLASARRRRQAEQREELRTRFGPEFDRAVEEQGSERKAQSKLAGVAKTRDKLEIRQLDAAERDRYETDWMSVQAAFVDAPDAAVRDADRLVGAVMRDRGYPVDDFDTKADMVAADHPTIAQNYRAAHAIRRRTDDGTGHNTDDLRQAFVHYRALFAELLADDTAGRHGAMTATDDQVDLSQHDRTTPEPPQR